MDVEIQLYAPPEFPFARRAVGRDQAQAMVLHNFGMLMEQQPEILCLTAQGDTLMLLVREAGRIRFSGQAYDLHFVYHFTFRDQKIAGVRQYASYTAWAHAAQPQ